MANGNIKVTIKGNTDKEIVGLAAGFATDQARVYRDQAKEAAASAKESRDRAEMAAQTAMENAQITTTIVESIADNAKTSQENADRAEANAKIAQNAAEGYLPLTGGTMTGELNAITPDAEDDSTKVATTAFVKEVKRDIPNQEYTVTQSITKEWPVLNGIKTTISGTKTTTNIGRYQIKEVPGIDAGTYTLSELLQKLVDQSKSYEFKFTNTDCNCNCDCDCSDDGA